MFIDSFLWTGQGLILLVVFALDCTFVLNPMAHFTRYINSWYSHQIKQQGSVDNNLGIDGLAGSRALDPNHCRQPNL